MLRAKSVLALACAVSLGALVQGRLAPAPPQRSFEPAPAFAGADLTALPTTGWLTNGGDLFNRRYSPLTEINADDGSCSWLDDGYSRAAADKLKATAFDRAAMGARNLPYERLDQLTFDILLGVR